MVTVHPTDPCPCGTGEPFGGCCLPLHRGERQAETAEELMRSRYSAYCVGDFEYVWKTWHPRTRAEQPVSGDGPTWMGLQIVDVVAGSRGMSTGRSSSARTTAKADEPGRYTSGPGSPLEPVDGSTWTGRSSIEGG